MKPTVRIINAARGGIVDEQALATALREGRVAGAGVDVYRLADDTAPQLLSFQRTRGWWGSNVSRQGDTMYLASGYWGVQSIDVAAH